MGNRISDLPGGESATKNTSLTCSDAGALSHAELIEQLRKIFNEHITKHISAMLAGLPEHLSTEADKCRDLKKTTHYFELRRQILFEREHIHRTFLATLNKKLVPVIRKLGNKEDEQELSLVSDDEMEELVAITSMNAHAINQFGEDISHLETRLEYLEISTESAIEKESLSPMRIGEAFQLTLKSHALELADRIELFSIFDSKVITNLGEMYKALNTLLINAGIMPQIVLKSTDSDESDGPKVTVRAVNYYDPQANPAKHFIPRSSRDIDYIANQFMLGEFSPSEKAIDLPESFRKPVSKDETDRRCFYERKDVMKALTRLQNQMLKQGKAQEKITTEDIKRSLFTDMGKHNKGLIDRQVNVLDERNIDFVGMMFNAITQDESISSVVKSLLMRLQIPVIKVALSDAKLFQRQKHPAREVLNLVTDAAKGVNDENDRIYGELEQIIDGILEEYDIDIESFNKASRAIQQLIETEQKITLENEKREQRQVMITHAREVVVDEVRHISSNKIIPRNVLPLITKSWPSLMMNRYIRYGNESWEWLESVMLMKLLVKCLQPIRNGAQWQTVWNNHMALVEAVQDELSTAKQEKTVINDQIEKLKDTFIDLLDAYGYKLVEESTLTTATMFTDVESEIERTLPQNDIPAANDAPDDDADDLRITHLAEVAKLAQAKLGKLPSVVHPGVWFEIYNGEDKAVRRLKLSVILTEVAKLVFVDRKGIKVIEKDAADFAAELEKSKSRFIADHSTFEHALGKVIHSIAA